MTEQRGLKWDREASLRSFRARRCCHCLELKGQKDLGRPGRSWDHSRSCSKSWVHGRGSRCCRQHPRHQERRTCPGFSSPAPESPSGPPSGWTDAENRGQRRLGAVILCDIGQGRVGQGTAQPSMWPQCPFSPWKCLPSPPSLWVSHPCRCLPLPGSPTAGFQGAQLVGGRGRWGVRGEIRLSFPTLPALLLHLWRGHVLPGLWMWLVAFLPWLHVPLGPTRTVMASIYCRPLADWLSPVGSLNPAHSCVSSIFICLFIQTTWVAFCFLPGPWLVSWPTAVFSKLLASVMLSPCLDQQLWNSSNSTDPSGRQTWFFVFVLTFYLFIYLLIIFI